MSKRIILNALIAKKNGGGGRQIVINFALKTLEDDELEWFYFMSQDVDDLIGMNFSHLKGTRYFVFPTQPDFKHSYFKVQNNVRRLEKEINPDIVYSILSPSYFAFKTKEVCRFANAWVTNPTAEAFSTLGFKEKMRMKLYSCNQRMMLKKRKYFITQSEMVANGLRRITKVPHDNVKVVPNVLPAFFSNVEVSGINRDLTEDVNISYIADGNPHKHIDIIHNIVNELKKRGLIERVKFHITLQDNSLALKLLRKDIEDGYVVNHGYCIQEQLISIYRECQVCLFPSLLETFSASLIEAMYFKQYIVASDFPFNKEITLGAAQYFKPMDAQDACDKIVTLITSTKIQSLLREQSVERISQYRDYNKHYNDIISFFKSI